MNTLEKSFQQYVVSKKARNCCIAASVLTVVSVAVPTMAIFFLFFAVVSGIIWASSNSHMKKRLDSMKANGTYEPMLREFANATSILDDKVRYSSNYIFSKKSDCFFKYNEIVWIYRHRLSYLFVPVSANAMIGAQTGKLYAFCKLKLSDQVGAAEIKKLATIVYNKNPNVLLGFGDAEKKAFNARTNKR